MKLIASPRFSDKRIGYLGMSLLIEEQADVLTLVTNSLSNDLNSTNNYAVGLALGALANVGSGDMLRDLSNSFHRMLENSDNYVKKKALLCVGLLFKHEPDLAPDFYSKIFPLLNDSSHAIQLTAISCLCQIAAIQSPTDRKPLRKCVQPVVKILKRLAGSGFAPEYDVSGQNDPHLQVACLRLLRFLGEKHEAASENMSDILAQVATNTDSAKNAGNAILNEVVRTIMGIEAEPGLRALVVNILGRFLSNKDMNIRYVGLATLEKLVKQDTAAVQRHRSTIVSCLKDADVSIRNRALDNVFQLLDESNVEELMREVVTYLGVAPIDQKAELSSRIADVVDRFAISRKWQIDTLLDILTVAGNYAPRRVWRHAVYLIGQSDADSMHSHVVHRLFSAICDRNTDVQLGLAQATLAVIGEYGHHLLQEPPASCTEAGFVVEQQTCSSILEALNYLQRAHDADSEMRCMGLVTSLKLAERLRDNLTSKDSAKLEALISMYRTSMNLELQARSSEYEKLFTQPDHVKSEVLKVMPVPNEQDLKRMRANRSPAAAGTSEVDDGQEPLLLSPTDMSQVQASQVSSSQAASKNLLDLDDLFNAPKPAAESTPGNLLDLFGGPQQGSNNTGVSSAFETNLFDAGPMLSVDQPNKLSMTIFENGPLRIVMRTEDPAVPPGKVTATAEFYNISNEPVSGVSMQVAVPTKYMSIKLSPASGTQLSVGEQAQVTQLMEFSNSVADKPYMMKLKVTYTTPSLGETVLQTVVNEFPK